MQRWLALGVALGLGLAQTAIPFWHTLDPPGRGMLETFINEFNGRQKEYRLEARYVGDIREGGIRLTGALRAGTAPALYYGEVSLVARAVKENLALPLDAYLTGLPTDFYPGTLESGRFRGKTYSLPVELNLPVLFYNTDQFAARQLTPPKTWEEIPSLAQRLTTRTAKGYIISSDIYSFTALVLSRGGRIVTEDGKPNFTDAKVVESLEFLQGLTQKGWAQSRPIAENQFLVVDFLRTKAMMVVAPINLWPVVEARSAIPFRIGVVPMPKAPGGKMPLAGGTLMVLRGANETQTKGAVAFWRYMMEVPQLVRWVQSTYALPLRKSAAAALEDWFRQDPRRKVAFAQLETAVPWVQDPEMTLWYDSLEQALEKALKGGMNAKQALEEAQKQALAVERR